MKNYSQEVIDNIQNAINEQNYSIIDINSFDELPHIIKSNGATIRLETINGRHSTAIELASTFDKSDEISYKQESLGKFYSRDWKRGNKGEETFKNYKIFKSTIKDIEITALIRNTSDYEYKEDEPLNYYCDITINDIPYTLIKAYCPNINESFATNSLFDEKNFSEKFMSSYGLFINENNETESLDDSPIDESDESVELF